VIPFKTYSISMQLFGMNIAYILLIRKKLQAAEA